VFPGTLHPSEEDTISKLFYSCAKHCTFTHTEKNQQSFQQFHKAALESQPSCPLFQPDIEANSPEAYQP